MIGKGPLWVAKQHGHSLTTMFRTYAAWAEGALESDIEVIRCAIQSDKSSVERSPNEENRSNVKSVARLGTGLATGSAAPEAQPTEIPIKKKWRRGWDSNPRAGITRPSDFESAPL
jgi:hypothetical protein